VAITARFLVAATWKFEVDTFECKIGWNTVEAICQVKTKAD
jgi:hypothetical protein